MSGADASATTAHEPGEEFAEIELTLTGNTGTGSAYINVDELGPNEPAYVSIEIDDDPGDNDQLLACADLRGQGNTGTGMTPRAPSAPGTAAPGGDNQGY